MPHKEKPNSSKNADDKRKRKFRWTKMFRLNSPDSPKKNHYREQIKSETKQLIPANRKHIEKFNAVENNFTRQTIGHRQKIPNQLNKKVNIESTKPLNVDVKLSVIEILERNKAKAKSLESIKCFDSHFSPNETFIELSSVVNETPVETNSKQVENILENNAKSFNSEEQLIKVISKPRRAISIVDQLNNLESGLKTNIKDVDCTLNKPVRLSGHDSSYDGLNKALSEKVREAIEKENGDTNSEVYDELVGITKGDFISQASTSEYIIIRFK